MRTVQSTGLLSQLVAGPANRVTLTRAVLAGVVAVLVVAATGGSGHVTALVLVSSVALALDAVDGRVARRTNTVTAFGARFDMEVDAFLILLLSGYAVHLVGPWVLAIGLARYGFVLAGRVLPWLAGQAPPRTWCKVVAAVQGITLTVVATGLLSPVGAVLLLAGSLALLIESFGREAWWLWRHRSPAAIPLQLERVAAHG
ncbi:MAG: CDP-alcohol phosphatidyltransferase [Marmoricola sp.]|nr:CDP-alcohol phosphatidyltransferase [Marmoricola sp.]